MAHGRTELGQAGDGQTQHLAWYGQEEWKLGCKSRLWALVPAVNTSLCLES